jgi:hypothetical protein
MLDIERSSLKRFKALPPSKGGYCFISFMHFGKQLELDDVPKDASPQAYEHEHEQANMSA